LSLASSRLVGALAESSHVNLVGLANATDLEIDAYSALICSNASAAPVGSELSASSVEAVLQLDWPAELVDAGSKDT
jgi:hypothetical protein